MKVLSNNLTTHRMQFRSIVVLLALLVTPALLSAQLKKIRAGIFAYDAGKFDVAIAELETGLKTPEDAKENLLAKGYLRLAQSYATVSDQNGLGGTLFKQFKDSVFVFAYKAHTSLQEAIKRKADTDFKLDVEQTKAQVGPLLYNASLDLSKQEKYAESIASFDLTEQYYPNQWFIYGTRAPLYLNVKDSTKAIADYEKTIAVFWSDTAAVNNYKDQMKGIYVTLSALYINYSKDLAKAKTLLEQALAKFPLEASLNRQYVYVMQQPQYKAEAIRYFQGKIEQEPGNVDYLIGYAQLLEESDPDASIAYYEKVIAIDPANLLANFNLGGIYANKAAVISKKAQELNNKVNLTSADEKQLDEYAEQTKVLCTKSLPYYQKAAEVAPEECAPIQNLAKIYTFLNMTAEAEAASAKANAVCGM
jgi:hypothetical protein